MKIAVHIYQFLSRIKIHTVHVLLEVILCTLKFGCLVVSLESFITCKPNYFSL